jgi:hypothetical protein
LNQLERAAILPIRSTSLRCVGRAGADDAALLERNTLDETSSTMTCTLLPEVNHAQESLASSSGVPHKVLAQHNLLSLILLPQRLTFAAKIRFRPNGGRAKAPRVK